METKEQERIIEPADIRRILVSNYYGSDIDKELDTKSVSGELAEYLDNWIKADRENQECNAVLALKKIREHLQTNAAVYVKVDPVSVLCSVNIIIDKTYGVLQ